MDLSPPVSMHTRAIWNLLWVRVCQGKLIFVRTGISIDFPIDLEDMKLIY